MSHLLQTPWTFYYFSKGADYEKSIKKFAKVTSIEEFWGAYSHMIRPDRLKPNTQLHFFRNDSRAMWEDDENKSGGAFLYVVHATHSAEAWEKLLLALIGEQLDQDIIGIVTQIRPDCQRIYIWNQTADIDLVTRLANELFKALEVPYKTKLCYNPHAKFLTNDGQSVVGTTTFMYEANGAVIHT